MVRPQKNLQNYFMTIVVSFQITFLVSLFLSMLHCVANWTRALLHFIDDGNGWKLAKSWRLLRSDVNDSETHFKCRAENCSFNLVAIIIMQKSVKDNSRTFSTTSSGGLPQVLGVSLSLVLTSLRNFGFWQEPIIWVLVFNLYVLWCADNST